MPRALRIHEAGFVHHVICRGNDRQNIFHHPQDFQSYQEFLDESRKLYPVKIYNFCLMTNHLHMLIEPRQEGHLSKFMEHLGKAYAKYFNREYNRVGHVFQGRFRSLLVQVERYFFMCSRYIDLNPVKAGVVKEPKEYAYSGYKYLGMGREPVIAVDEHELYRGLGKNSVERQIAYRGFVMMPQTQAEVRLIEHRRGHILGDDDFVAQFSKR